MKKTLLFFFVFVSISCWAQFSKTHYIPPLTAQNTLAEDQYLYISTPSSLNVSVKIIEIGGNTITRVLTNSNPIIYFIGQGNNSQLFIPKANTGKVSNKGYIIEADDLVYASVRVTAQKNNQRGVVSYAHAGGLVSKGNSALGTEFRLGAMLNPLFDFSLLNFASILSTENGTTISISNIPNGTLLSNGTVFNDPLNITLNKNESYVLALENIDDSVPSNSSKIIGALVTSDKPVVVNSGSFGGSNSTDLLANQNGNLVPSGRDIGFDQIVPLEKTGTEYIFVKGAGTDELERIILIAHKPNTSIYINGILTPYITLVNAGDYVAIDGSQFSNGNLYVSSSNKVFAYQCIGGNSTVYSPPANQNLFFVPPLNCATPNAVDNIPYIEQIGSINYSDGSLNIVTETGATVLINGDPVTSLPFPIEGKPDFERYSIPNLRGNIAVKSSKQVYVSFYSSNGAATYGGYYSGFDTKPEITSEISIGATSSCIPNVVLKVSSITAYDTFEWSFNGAPIPSSNTNSYTPTQPGYYQVKGSITGCDSFYSDKIPVSNCPTDLDNDLTNDNIDLDNDNDGITNCTESYGNLDLNISNPNAGNVAVGLYTNSFTGATATSGPGLPKGTFSGSTDGSFITQVPAGKENSISQTLTFANLISIGIEYVSSANAIDLVNPDAEYTIKSDINKTITVLNPDNQLLIDTNYDGIFESGVSQFSSFEIRFRLNSAISLPAGSGTFKFLSYLTQSISFTHKNLSEDNLNKSTFKFFAVCVPKDSDGDGIFDQLDLDSDNDGIPDLIEAQGQNNDSPSTVDLNNDGIYDVFGSGINPIDSDEDGIFDYLDLDSDNDGIRDAKETAIDTDTDGIPNYRDLDSDNDSCADVIEAGFTDGNNDGFLGNNPVIVDINGIVTSGTDGYTPPNNQYLLAGPINIRTQPQVAATCELENTSFTLEDNGGSTYQWQIFSGTIWTNIADNTTYSGATTKTLSITRVSNAMNGNRYQVKLSKNGNTCGLISSETALTVYSLPLVNEISIVQCDENADGISTFNLTVKNDFISINASNETFTYYSSLAGANSVNQGELITNPMAFVNTTANEMQIGVRVENANGCSNTVKLDLIVSVTQIDPTFHRDFAACDDTFPSDTDGFSVFDFHTVTDAIQTILPAPSSNYTIKYYPNEADALSEINEITNPSNYRNTILNKQDIWVRVDSNLDNACFGLGPFITLTVNPLPKINLNSNGSENQFVCKNLPDLFVKLDSGIQDGSPTSDYTYIWTKDGAILNGKTSSTIDVNVEGIYTVEVKSLAACSRIRTLKVTASEVAHIESIAVVDLKETNSITITVTGQGNYEYRLDNQNGPFQTSNFFDNVSAGIHEVYIIDLNGCGTISAAVAVISIPKYFTPNADGFNDYWNIKGVDASFNSKSIINIFDRYGKLLEKILPSSQGWNGTFNGLPLPADDYWFTLKLEDGRETKGHFSLKR